jgi:hypothetical protein
VLVFVVAATVVAAEDTVRRRRKEGVELVGVAAAGLSLEMRLVEGVLKGVVTVTVPLFWRGVVDEVWKRSWVVRVDFGVEAKRAVVGVVVAVVARVLTVRGLLGVAAGRVMVAVVGFEGVRPRRSKMPRTRPSLCGVGLIEVGAAPRGVRAVRSRDGVMAGWVADGDWAPDGMASAGGKWRVF